MSARLITLLLIMILLRTASGFAETRFVDNKEIDKNDLMRLNMRSEPSPSGAVIGSYYTGAEVTILDGPIILKNSENSNEEAGNESQIEGEKAEVIYYHVEIGGKQGYMAGAYLINEEEVKVLYGDESSFGRCRNAELDLTGMWGSTATLLSSTDSKAETVNTLINGESLHLVGIVNNWGYVFVDNNGEKQFGYLPIDMITEIYPNKVFIVSTSSADIHLKLYESPGLKSKEIMDIANGTACFMLFGRGVGEWRRVRIGGVSGWINPSKTAGIVPLGERSRSSIPYYPLVMEMKNDSLLYSTKGDKVKPYMTLGKQMKVEILAESDNFVYARTLIGAGGTFDKGDFGYIYLSDLTLSTVQSSYGVVQADDEDLPILVYNSSDVNANVIGALCGGAQVRVADYTQTDYVRIKMNNMNGFVKKNCVRLITQPTDSISERIPQRAVVKKDISMLNEPSTEGSPILEIQSGKRVYILGKFGDWVYVNSTLDSNLSLEDKGLDGTGFAQIKDLNAPASTIHLSAFTKTDKVNLRSIADKSGEIISRVHLGERLLIAEYGTQWTCVVTPEGKRGYIMTDYLDFD